MNREPWTEGARAAGGHALGWLVAANAVGTMLAAWLAWPPLAGCFGELGYGRWVPLHLDWQLYGWTALPLVGWLFVVYRAGRGARTALAAWSAALGIGALWWLGGRTSGKVFLDWTAGSLAAWLAAAAVLWVVLARGWWRARRSGAWTMAGARWRGAGLAGLAMVGVSMAWAASPGIYPPIDTSTGGPTGASLLGSTLVVVALMLMLPRVPGLGRLKGGGTWPWWLWAGECAAWAVLEAKGGTHAEAAQISAMVLLLPWLAIIPADWRKFRWPAGALGWRRNVIGWWGLLVATGFLVFLPGVLDRSKFTQVLVAHSHLAMAGFTTSFAILLLGRLGAWSGGAAWLRWAWNAALAGQLGALAWMGWLEGAGPEWMIEPPAWRVAGMWLRLACGAAMLAVSVAWWLDWRRETSGFKVASEWRQKS